MSVVQLWLQLKFVELVRLQCMGLGEAVPGRRVPEWSDKDLTQSGNAQRMLENRARTTSQGEGATVMSL